MVHLIKTSDECENILLLLIDISHLGIFIVNLEVFIMVICIICVYYSLLRCPIQEFYCKFKNF